MFDPPGDPTTRTRWQVFATDTQTPRALIAWWIPGLVEGRGVAERSSLLGELGLRAATEEDLVTVDGVTAMITGRDVLLRTDDGHQIETFAGAAADPLLQRAVEDGVLGLLGCVTEIPADVDPAFALGRLISTGQVLAGQVTVTVREAPQAGRNDSCPCGSGRKYKRCCA